MIYFAQADGTELVKIGYTGGDPHKRLSELQTGCPHRLILLTAIEDAVFLCASFDGAGVITDAGHLYVPIAWLRREHPDAGEVCDLIERKIRAHVAAGGLSGQ